MSSIFHIKCTPSLEFLLAVLTRLFLFLSYISVGHRAAHASPKLHVPVQLTVLVRAMEPDSGWTSGSVVEQLRWWGGTGEDGTRSTKVLAGMLHPAERGAGQRSRQMAPSVKNDLGEMV